MTDPEAPEPEAPENDVPDNDIYDDPVALLALLQSVADIVTVVGADNKVRFVSDAFHRILGYASPPVEVPAPFIHPDDVDRMVSQMEDHLARRAGPPVEYRARHADGRWLWMEDRTANLLDDPDVRAVVSITRDVTARKEAEEEIRRLTSHDGLTDLPNRALLTERLAETISSLDPDDPPVAVLVLDLDGFASVNNRFGQKAGDEALREVAARLRAAAGPEDTVARYGSDEFVVARGPRQERGTAELVQLLSTAVSAPIDLPGGRVELSATIGVHEVHDPATSPHQAIALAMDDVYQRKASPDAR